MITRSKYTTSIVSDLGYNVIRTCVADNSCSTIIMQPATSEEHTYTPAASVDVSSIKAITLLRAHCDEVLLELKRRNTNRVGDCKITHRGNTIYNIEGKCVCCGATFTE